ncbi:Csu type fimbrial protein [Halomonas denitrificans]|nr:spore coat U domain-containing protein [Halomonas denitrificans]
MTTTLRSVIALTLLGASAAARCCTVSASGLAFGSYDPFDALHRDSTATITVDCPTPYTVELDAGQSGNFTLRSMSSIDDTLQYNIYTSPTYTIVAGDGTGATQTLAGSGAPTPTDHVVYGRIFALQNPMIGSYSDLIVVTVNF